MTHKDADFWLFSGDIPFRRINLFLGELSPPVVKQFTTLGAGSAGAKNRLGNIDGTLEASADENSGTGGLHRIYGIGLAESVRVELDAERIRQALHIGRGFNPTDNTTISNSSSFTPSSDVEYRMVTFLVFGSSLTTEV